MDVDSPSLCCRSLKTNSFAAIFTCFFPACLSLWSPWNIHGQWKAEGCMQPKHSHCLFIPKFHSHYVTLQGDSLKTFWRCNLLFHSQVITAVCQSQSIAMQLWCSLGDFQCAFPDASCTAPSKYTYCICSTALLSLDKG